MGLEEGPIQIWMVKNKGVWGRGYALSYDDDDPLDQETDPGPLGLWGSAAKIILTTVGREHYPHDIQWPEEKEK